MSDLSEITRLAAAINNVGRRHLHLDFETFSEADIEEVGAYRYAEDDSTEILMAAYALDNEPVKLWVPAEGQPMPADLQAYLADPRIFTVAWNANFERCVIRNRLPHIDARPHRFLCAMVQSLYLGLPGKLEMAGKAMRLGEDKAKLKEGKALVRKFCCPSRPTKKHPHTRWLPEHDPEAWERFKQYCVRDVESERLIWNKQQAYAPVPAEEWETWWIDQEINDRGVLLDPQLVEAAVDLGARNTETLLAEIRRITGVANPNAPAQLRTWLLGNDVPADLLPNMQAETIEELLNRPDLLPPRAYRALELRAEVAKASISKYQKMLAARCRDGRVHGTLQFYGANRTGRWAGRLVQPQNMYRGDFEGVELFTPARELLRQRALDALEAIFGSGPGALATLVRTVIVAGVDARLVVADLSAIEARVVAWGAGEQWRLEVFRTHGKIYEASASTSFKIPFEEFERHKKETGKHHPLRKKGKVTELACGYQGSVGALIRMGALKEGLKEEELKPMVDAWRAASPNIVAFWWAMDRAAKAAIRGRRKVKVETSAGVVAEFDCDGKMLTMRLPSGRKLYYAQPAIEKNSEGREQITYWGVDQKTKQWGLQRTYGGKLVENWTQAVARDVMREIVRRLYRMGYALTLLVHDEAVAEMANGRGSKAEMIAAMSKPIQWAPGLPLGAAGFENPYYMKD